MTNDEPNQEELKFSELLKQKPVKHRRNSRPTKQKVKEGIAGLKNAINGQLDDWSEDMTTRVRMDYMSRWMEITNNEYDEPCTSYEDIDFSIPQISLEWKLCDPKNLYALRDENKRMKFLSTLTPEELSIYYKIDSSGASYQDLERPPKTRTVMKGVVQRAKGR